MLTQIMHVNFSSMTAPHLISVVQGDTGRNLKCIVDDFTLDGAWTATWYVERPSDVPVYNTATIETSDNSVNLELTAQSINEVGDNKLQVRILDADDQVVTSFACILSVKPFGGIGAVESSTEANIFDQQVEEAVETISTHAEDAIEEIDTALDEHLENGIFPSMTAGGLAGDSYAENKVPYFFRPSGGGAEVGTIESPVLVGGSVGWNQYVTFNAQGAVTEKGITCIRNADGSVEISGTATADWYVNVGNTVTSFLNHKILIKGCPSGGSTSTYSIRDGYTSGDTNKDFGNGRIIDGKANFIIQIIVKSGTALPTPIIFVPQAIDLTQMFGSTIADRLYSLEQSTADSGIAQLKAWGFDFDEYIPYTAPTLKHVEGVSAHKFVGFNQFNGTFEYGNIDSSGADSGSSTNYIRSIGYTRVLPSTEYCEYIEHSQDYLQVYYLQYDANKNIISRTLLYNSGTTKVSNRTFTTAANTAYVRTFMYNSTAFTSLSGLKCCISISSSRNGEYEPYKTWSYALDATLTLRGIPKLDANNQLYYDGDTYAPDGTVTRKYAIRAYQSGDESLTDAITDGTNTVYKLSTPTTETATPFAEYQEVDASGTEEYVSTGVVPVGHVTKYPTDLKGTFETILSAIPSANGTYALKVTVANGKRTFSWV